MKITELFALPEFLNALRALAPASRFSGHPLTLVSSGDGLWLSWENCMESDWWVGMQDAVYTRQDIRPVTEEEIIAAARAAGLDVDLVVMALGGRGLEQ